MSNETSNIFKKKAAKQYTGSYLDGVFHKLGPLQLASVLVLNVLRYGYIDLGFFSQVWILAKLTYTLCGAIEYCMM